MRYCGMDVSDRSSRICIIDEGGEVIHEGLVMNDPDGLRQYFEGMEPMVVGIEACGTSAWLAEEIGRYGHEVKVVHPQSIEALVRGRKTDRNDARMLAQVLRGGWYREVYQKSREARWLRSLIQARGQLAMTESRISVQIQGLMKHWGRAVGSSRAADFIDRVEERLTQEPMLGGILRPLLDALMGIREQLKRLTALLKATSRGNADAALLMTHPGVGPVTAMAFLGTIDNPERFEKSRQVGAYVGLTARVNQSGEVDRHGRITKNGDAVLRGYLLTAAHAILRKGTRFCKLKAWGLRLAKKKGYSKAKVAVARKIAVHLHRMLIDRRPFDHALAEGC